MNPRANRICPGALLLLMALVWMTPASGRSLTLRPLAAPEKAAVAEFEPRFFPRFLQIGEPVALDPSEQSGNARWSSVTARPTVLRDTPRLLSDLGSEPAAELRKIANETEPETVRICGLRVDFLRDSAGDASTGDGRFDLRHPDSARIAIDAPPHNRTYFEAHFEALRRYYAVQSNGGLVLEYDVFPAERDSAYHLPDTDRYGPWIFSVSSDSILARAERFVRESLELADSLDDSIEWDHYQSFLVFHAGADFQGDIRRDTNYDIPSFNLFLGDSLEVYVGGPDSVMINLVMVVPETVSQDEFTGALNGVLAHEFGHQLGFFDLYDVYTGLPAVGVYSLMDSGDGQFGTVADPYQDDGVIAVRGILPASLDPWNKLITPGLQQGMVLHEAEDGAEIDLPAVLRGGDILYAPVHLSEYFLVETRPLDYNGDDQVILRADPETGVVLGPEPAEDAPEDELARLEYDFLLPGAGGVIIWHIDEFAAITGLNTYGGVNIFSDRRGVDVEEADGIQDIGSASPEFLGGPYDPFFVGGFTHFGPSTLPDSRTNDGTHTGIDLEILDPPGISMRIAVGVPQQLAGWPLAFEGLIPPHGLGRVDLGGDGLDEILLTIGPVLAGVTADGDGFAAGGERYEFASLPDTLEEGPVIALDGGGFPTFDLPAIGARAAGTASWFDISGEELASWGRGTGDEEVVAGPVLASGLPESKWLVGTASGRVHGLLHYDVDVFGPVWTLPPMGEAPADSITALMGGTTSPGSSPFWFAYGTYGGRVDLYGSELDGLQPERLAGWPQQIGGGAVRDLIAFRAPLRLDDEPRDLLLVTTEDRRIDLRTHDGRSVSGWPQAVKDTLAGSPAIGDPDGDGLLEIIATTRSGEIYLWDLRGAVEPFWPQEIWHPDQTRRIECRTGPRLWDVGADGTVEIVQLRGDGMVHVLDGRGQALDGWPRATGSPGWEGPEHLIAADGSERWYVASALSDTVTAVSGLLVPRGDTVQEATPGSYARPGVDPGRSGVYPLALVPEPQGVESFFDAATLVVHPNPLRGDRLRVHYVLGSEATIRGQIFDISGRSREEEIWQGHAGASGETYYWDLSGLASGTYVLRLRIEGPEESRSVTRSIAVVR